jgi:hypothetical protein
VVSVQGCAYNPSQSLPFTFWDLEVLRKIPYGDVKLVVCGFIATGSHPTCCLESSYLGVRQRLGIWVLFSGVTVNKAKQKQAEPRDRER